MKKLLLLSTGGTIASVASNAGLVPKETGEELIKMLGKLPYDIHVKDILQLDSIPSPPKKNLSSSTPSKFSPISHARALPGERVVKG